MPDHTTKNIRIASMSGVDSDGKHYGLSYPWVCTDAGRAASKRPRQKNDCTVRALALVRDLPYDEAYELLKDAGRQCSRGFVFATWISKQAGIRKISFPAIRGQRRMTPSEFVIKHPQGRYICKVAKHVFAVIDGVVHDDFENAPDRCVYTAWQIG